MTVKHSHLLMNLLRTIVEEYGHDEVLRTLTCLPTDSQAELLPETKRHLRQDKPRHRETVKPKRPTAVDQAIKICSIAEEPDALLALAAKFDRKEFLPSVGDIREFLAMMGVNIEGMKDRIEGFRHLLPVLIKLPPERIRGLANGSSHSGPAQLGPLADAIRSAGESMRRNDQAPIFDPTATPSDGSPNDTAHGPMESRGSTANPAKTHVADERSAKTLTTKSDE